MSWETYVKDRNGKIVDCGKWNVNEPVERDYEAMQMALAMQLLSDKLRDMEYFQIELHHRHTPKTGWIVNVERFK